jgi:hypothetical protein
VSQLDILLIEPGPAALASRALAALLDDRALDARVLVLTNDDQNGGAMSSAMDPRLEVLGVPADRSNLVLADCLRSDYSLLLAPDAVPLPGGISRMLEVLRGLPDVAAVLGPTMPMSVDGRSDRERVRDRTRRHLQRVSRFEDDAYVAVYGCDEIGALLCRRSALRDIRLASPSVDAIASVLRVLGESSFTVLADPVCAQFDRPSSSPASASVRVRRMVGRLRAYRRSRPGELRSLIEMTRAGAVAALGLEGVIYRMRETCSRLWQRLAWRTVVPLGERVYDLLLTRYEDWPISPLPEPAANSGVARHVAYYIWRFPVLSETFIRRELGALEEAGVDVTILADGPGAGAPSDPELRPFVRRTRYVLPVAPRRILLDLITSVATRPLRTASAAARSCAPI